MGKLLATGELVMKGLMITHRISNTCSHQTFPLSLLYYIMNVPQSGTSTWDVFGWYLHIHTLCVLTVYNTGCLYMTCNLHFSK